MKEIVILILVGVIILLLILHMNLKKDLKAITELINEHVSNDDSRILKYRTEFSSIKELTGIINKFILKKRKEKNYMDSREQNIKEMISNVSHDLKTPLTVIQGYAEILRLDCSNHQDSKEMIDNIIDRTVEVNNLISQFFSLAKLESGDERVELSIVNASKIIRNIMAKHINNLERMNFEINIDIPDEDVYLLGNTLAFERVFDNLISNVINYGSDGKYIGIRIYEYEETISISVSDRGIGISNESIHKVFYRSYVVDKSRSRENRGNGLGLTIVRNLVEKMNGEISVKSECNVLTEFIIKFKK